MTKEDKIDNTLFDESLQLIAKGTSIILIGAFIGSILAAIYPIIIARYYTPAEFGIYALAMTIFLFLTQISFLGLDDGCPRNISFYRGKKDYQAVKNVINSSFQIITVFSILISIALFLASDWISWNIFNNQNLVLPLKILSLTIPFHLFTGIIISIFRGFDKPKENAYFSQILTGIGKIILIIPIIILGLSSINYVFIALAANTLLVFLIVIIYYKIRKPSELKIKLEKKSSIKKELLIFSLPLVFSGISWFLLQSTDKFMIGFMKGEYDVGLYNTAVTVASYLNIFLVSIMFIYQPVGTKLFGAGKNLEIKELYKTITKWVFLLASPLIMFVILLPKVTIYVLFGSEYLGAIIPLMILFITYAFRICLGPAGGSVIMLGKTKQIMYIVAAVSLLNIVLNWFLIPDYGITGAAIATGVAIVLLSVFESLYLYKISKIHPIKKVYIKMLFIFLFVMTTVYLIFQYTPIPFSILTKIILIILSYLLFIVLLAIFNLFKEEDLLLVKLIEQKLRIKIPFIRKIIR